MVSVNLARNFERPAFNVETAFDEDVLCLLDTGALISVWCQRKFLFLRHFPNAVKTNYVTTVSGFGGKSLVKREVWKIPQLVLKDSNGNGAYVVKNLLVALVENSTAMTFKLVLSSKIFHGSSFHIFDVDTDDKRVEIHPMADRPVVCVIKGTIAESDLEDVSPDGFKLDDDEVFIKGTTVFVEE